MAEPGTPTMVGPFLEGQPGGNGTMRQEAPVLSRLESDPAGLPDYVTVEQVLAHPRFALARNHYMRAMVDSYRTDPAMQHLMHEFARTVLFNIILGYHARQVDEDGFTSLSVGMLRDIFMPFNLASPRSFDQMLARMQVIGLVTITPAPEDRRRRLVTPTPKMIEEDLDWLADHMSPLAILLPERDDYEPALQRDIRYQRAQRIVSTQNYGGARDILGPEDPILTLFQRQDATTIIYTYLLAAWEGGDPFLVSLPYETAARSLSISRTHVRNLLTDFQAAGLLTLGGSGGRDIAIQPALWHVVDLFLARSMSGHDLVWQLARQIVAAHPSPGHRSTQ